MKVFIDSNLLIYLNVLKSTYRAVYENFYLNLLSANKLYLDALVPDELIYVSKRRYDVPYEYTLNFFESIVSPYVEILPLGEREYIEASKILKTYKIKPSDALHIAAMTINGILKIASEDEEVGRVEEIQRIWL